jgi:hypothetical protein
MEPVNEMSAPAPADASAKPALGPINDIKAYSQAEGAHHIFKDVYSFFGNKIMNSVAVYVGCDNWKLDLQLIESYAFPTVVCDPFSTDPQWAAAVLEKRGRLMDWMKYLKESDCGTHFVNPKWIQPLNAYPGNFDGVRNITPDTVVPVVSWEKLVETATALRNKPSSDEPHFALCRIELYNEETKILASLLASKYRPSILYVRWTESPDESQVHCESAGHLQSCGYRLVTINSNGFFLYQYTGQDIYSCCSWLKSGMAHPFIELMRDQALEFVESLRNPVSQVEGNEPAVSEGAPNS